MKNLYRNIIIVLLFISVIVVITFQSINKGEDGIELTVITMPASNCIPQEQICNVESDKFKFEVSFDENVYYLKPFTISVKTLEKNNHEIISIVVDFKMKSMDMGVNRFKLLKVNKMDGKKSWIGKVLLPICVVRRADWNSEIEIITKQNKYIYSFPLDVKKTNN